MMLLNIFGIICLSNLVYPQASYNRGSGSGGSFSSPGTGLEETIPGTPGEDYPIYAEVPETSFFCDGQVDGGYYGDPEAECQVFHMCAGDGFGGLSKYSFLCPNGTLFQQQYFVCDWWFNVDCSTTEDFYSLNDEYAAEREANSPGGDSYQGQGGQGGRRSGTGGFQSGGGYSATSGADYGNPDGALGGYARHSREVSTWASKQDFLDIPIHGAVQDLEQQTEATNKVI